MTSHFILLRHQEGADWDYCLIQHVGAKPTVEIPATTSPSASIAWHEDSFVSGPSWGEFQKVMGLAGDQSGQPVFVVSVQRAVPGHRSQLLDVLNQRSPNAKVYGEQPGDDARRRGAVAVPHARPLQLVADLGADRAASTGVQGWLDVRQHSAYHTDTIADRVR